MWEEAGWKEAQRGSRKTNKSEVELGVWGRNKGR